jgi:hypothetical protein
MSDGDEEWGTKTPPVGFGRYVDGSLVMFRLPVRGVTTKSAALANLLCRTNIRDMVILTLLRHTNSGMLYRFIVEDSF